MSQNPPSLLESLIQALRCLPSVGPKSAQRMAYHLLQYDQKGAHKLVLALDEALAKLRHCEQCNSFSEHTICQLCSNPKRDFSQLCIVEMPTDLLMIEQTQSYHGLFYVLMGRISPLDGIGPKELSLDKLCKRITEYPVTEVIIATNFTNEGEATAHVISQLLARFNVTISRLSRGVPVGGELELTDSGTIAQALLERRILP